MVSGMPQFVPRLFSTITKAAITLLLLWLLFRRIDYTATLRHLRDITPFTAIVGLLLLCAAIALATARWKIVLRSIGQRLTKWSLFRLNLIGLFFNQALPSAIGGDGMRAWLLYRHGCTFPEAFNSVLIDRIAGFVILATMSLYGLPTLVERLFAISKVQIITTIIFATIMLILFLYALWCSSARISRFRVGRFLAQLVADALFLAARPLDSANIALLSMGNLLCNFALIWLILRDLGTDVSVLGVMIVAPVVLLLLVLPISIAGWGLREGLFVVGFGLLNVPKDLALAASIVFGLMNLLAGLIGGIFWMFEPTRSRNSIMKPPATAETSLAQFPDKRL